MHLDIVFAVVIIVIAAVLYLRRHAAVEAKIEADASSLKNSATTEAKKIETAVETDLKHL
jgi:hypothetical protein